MTDRTATPRTGSCRAVVLAGADATPYFRCGAGRPVVFLCQDPDAPLWTALLEAVAGQFRVIAPEATAGRPDFERWLRQFLDGLGLGSVALVVDQALAAPAIGFAILEPERVERMGVISPTGPVFPGSIVDGGHPILFLRDDRPPTQVVGAVLRFLDGGRSQVGKAG